MYLSDVDILKALRIGNITIKNFDKKRLQPASYDILLGNTFVVTDSNQTDLIDPLKQKLAKTRKIKVPDGESFVLHPGVSVLGSSYDFVGAKKDYLIQITGKSSLARIGLLIHNTAGLINPGHYLNITLELCNLNSVPIILRPKMEIAQLLFGKLSSPPLKSYQVNGRYHKNNKGTVKAVF